MLEPVAHGGGLLAVGGKLQDAGESALEVDAQAVALGHEDDLVDEAAQDLGGLGAGLVLLQRLVELGDLAAVDRGEGRMDQRPRLGRLGEDRGELLLARLETQQLVLEGAGGDAVGDRLDELA